MDNRYTELLNPVGTTEIRRGGEVAGSGKTEKARVIGLLNNSKPNVTFFLRAIEEAIRAEGTGYQILNSVKPRSAGPSPAVDLLAQRCEFVINAVSD